MLLVHLFLITIFLQLSTAYDLTSVSLSANVCPCLSLSLPDSSHIVACHALQGGGHAMGMGVMLSNPVAAQQHYAVSVADTLCLYLYLLMLFARIQYFVVD